MDLSACSICNALSAATGLCRDWEDTTGRTFLWSVLASLLVDAPYMGKFNDRIDLLTPTIIFFRSKAGLSLYTTKGLQVSIHFVIPKTTERTAELIQQTATFMCNLHPESSINMNPLKTHVSILQGECFARKRFIPTPDRINEIVFQNDQVVFMSNTTPAHNVLSSAKDVVHYKPITRMDPEDPESTVYWYRFRCGKLVTFRNPYLDTVESIPFPKHADMDQVKVNINETLSQALKPQSIDQSINSLSDDRIPHIIRQLFVKVAKTRFGISDLLIIAVGAHFVLMDNNMYLLNEMIVMSDIMTQAQRLTHTSLGETLVVAMLASSDQLAWRRWMLCSKFIFACVDRVSKDVLDSMCRKYHFFRVVLCRLLHHRIGNWTQDDQAKAVGLEAYGVAVDDTFNAVADELQRLRERADAMALTFEKEQHHEEQPTPPQQALPAVRNYDTIHVCRSPSATQEATHMPLVKAMMSSFSLKMDLIGSGVFCDDSDADVVITVETATSLQEAYETVERITGWERCYEMVTGEHVAVLSGTFQGIAVDAQVWRGADRVETKTEHMTLDALQFTEHFSQQVGPDRENVRTLHRWFKAADLKGHRLCKLPGVAVTCIAVVIGCRVQAFSSLLSCLRATLSRSAPYVNFDELTYEGEHYQPHDNSRCMVPIAVTLRGKNCSSRLSVGTTRHLLDTLAFTMSLDDTLWLHSNVYSQWRDATMIRAALVQPLYGHSLHQSLHVIAASFDGHPLIDAIHFSEETNGNIIVRCTMHSDADVRRYGFRDTDRVTVDNEQTVTIHRNGRVMILMQSHRPATVHTLGTGVVLANEHRRVTDMLWVETIEEGRSIPNAPGLTCDIMGRFDSRLWKCVL